MAIHNVVVLGGAYAGAHAFRLLANGLGEEFRIILIDRNDHVNHLDAFARYSVLPGHEHKAFIPFKGVVHPIKASDPAPPPNPHHATLHARIIALKPYEVTIDRTFPELGFDSPAIPFKYAVYALGSHLPPCIDLWSGKENSIVTRPQTEKLEDGDMKLRKEYDGTKPEGIEWFRSWQEKVRRDGSVLCVGGGALGIQYATDIKSVYPEKEITLLHSRDQLLPRFDFQLHCEVREAMEDLGINLILGERLDLASMLPENAKYNERGQRVVWTLKGREIAADRILLCIGQRPNTELISSMSPQSIDPTTKLAYVLPTLQLGIIPSVEKPIANGANEEPMQTSGGPNEAKPEKLPETPYPHIFVAGDCADAFGAIKMGRVAYFQAEVAARNLIRLAQWEMNIEGKPECQSQQDETNRADIQDDSLEMEPYKPPPPAIKVTIGVGKAPAYQLEGKIGRWDHPMPDDLNAPQAWSLFGLLDAKPEDMYA